MKNTIFRETADSQYVYKNELDKACFQHDMVYGDFENLTERTSQAEILREHASMVYNIFEKKLVLVVLKMRIPHAIL